MATKRDFYEVLGIQKGASKDAIKSAYRKLAMQYHPDRNKAADAEQKFKEVNEAYQVLGDDQKRQTYDQFGHAAFDQSAGMGGGNPFAGGFQQGGPFSYTYTQQGGGNPFSGFEFSGDPFEIFESFFGGNPFGGRGRHKPRYTLSVSFMEAVLGAEKTVTIEGKQHKIKIPAGADHGTRIQFKEFDITLDVQADKVFKRENNDIYVDVQVPFTLAILGGVITVPTLDGELQLKIRPGTQPNTMVRLREQGVQFLQSRGRGDEYIRLVVSLPEKLNRKQRDLLEEFDQSR